MPALGGPVSLEKSLDVANGMLAAHGLTGALGSAYGCAPAATCQLCHSRVVVASCADLSWRAGGTRATRADG